MNPRLAPAWPARFDKSRNFADERLVRPLLVGNVSQQERLKLGVVRAGGWHGLAFQVRTSFVLIERNLLTPLPKKLQTRDKCRLLRQFFHTLSQPPQNSRLGLVHVGHIHSQFLGNVCRRLVLGGREPERLPSLRITICPHDFQHPPRQASVEIGQADQLFKIALDGFNPGTMTMGD